MRESAEKLGVSGRFESASKGSISKGTVSEAD